MLKENGFSAEAYHAGMKNEDRELVQNDFMAGKTNTVIATIAFGMGIDKENIRKVIHYDLPKSIESYSQEIGRAGRDGNPSLCCLFGNKNGMPVLENFTYGDTPTVENIRQVLESIGHCEGNRFEVRVSSLSRNSDIRLLPLKTMLVYLEMANIIFPKYTYFENYAFKYLIPADNIIDKFKGERAQFVKTILNNCTTAKTWTRIDIVNTIAESDADRQRVLTALEYFHEKGWIDLQPKSAVEVFEILNSDFDIDSTARDLTNLFVEKEKMDISRLHEMIDLFETDRCLAKSLSAYFGEKLDDDCKRFSVCMSNESVKLLSSDLPSLDIFNFHDLVQPLKDTVKSPLSVTLITRFLCGISSPRLSIYRARQMDDFGRLEEYPYKTVEKWVLLHNK